MDLFEKRYKNSLELQVQSADFVPRFPLDLEATLLSALATLAFPGFDSFVFFALVLVESAVSSPSPVGLAFLAFGFFAGATFDVEASSSFSFLGDFES